MTAKLQISLVSLSLVILGFPRDGFALEKVRIAIPTVAVMYAPLYLGIREGFFAKEGLAVEVLSMRTDLAIAALGAGEIDFLAHGGAALRAAAQGFSAQACLCARS
ncbi:MAG: hypothetical protein ACREQW_23515 [Candidatus Binatia bacterium]